ncbi:MAG: hypothetical protein DI536_37510 [Archangium gephyra]|uniref:Carbohydrate kinase PfkB domain-containing protein n=1 Tax=Archangium gephyra TaxID=48 RepID=A0A2W5SHE6_9BACT|nr:MAG: hypothetical protein DI536_37510 [Archangium gephyra]
MAAAQKYRRRFVSFETDFEGMVANRGEVVLISHDLFAMQQASSWGYSGRLVAGTTTQLTLDRAVPFTAGQQHYVGVRFPDNTFHVQPVMYVAGETDTLTLSQPLPSAPSADPNNPVVDYLWFFGINADGPVKRMKVDSVDVLVVNEGELTALTGRGTVAAQIARLAVPCVVVTLGERGCVARRGAELFLQPAFPVDAVDTTAAGDTFCGALTARLSEHAGLADALRFASAASALACTRLGAQASIPARTDVDAWLAMQVDDPARQAALAVYCGIP